jgi:hypothetical protein
MAELPSQEDLKKLPIRSIVAYTVRNARRVQPLFLEAIEIDNYKEHLPSVDKALTLSMLWTNGENVSSEDLNAARIAATTAAKAARTSTTSAFTAASITTSAVAAAKNAAACDRVSRAAIFARHGVRVATTIVAQAESAAIIDFQKLVALNLTNEDGVDA